MTYEEIREKLKNTLPEDRFYHSLGVADTVAFLASFYGEDFNKARLAGLVHDCAKGYKTAENIALCESNNIPVSEAERKNPQLLHAKLGSFFAKEIYGICDEEILDAIACHTTGKINMNLFEKLLFIADYIEPGRNRAKRLDAIRKEALINVDNCIVMILKDTLDYLNELNYNVDNITVETYEFYKGVING